MDENIILVHLGERFVSYTFATLEVGLLVRIVNGPPSKCPFFQDPSPFIDTALGAL